MNFPSRRGFLSSSVACLAMATLSQPRASSAAAPFVLYKGPGPIELGIGATHVQLSPAWLGAVNMIDPRFTLSLTGLSERSPAGVHYDVYLDHGDSPLLSPRPSHRAGRLVFDTGDKRFDVTAILLRLPMDAENLTLSLIPSGRPDPAAVPRIGALAIVL